MLTRTLSIPPYSQMLRRRPWYDSYILGSTFNQVATACKWKHNQFVKVKIEERREQAVAHTGLSGLDVQILGQISFEYLVRYGDSCHLHNEKSLGYLNACCILTQPCVSLEPC